MRALERPPERGPLDELRRSLGGRAVAVLRVGDPTTALHAVEALAAGGLSAVEVTLCTKSALDVLVALRRTFPEVAVGAGSVRDAEQLGAVCRAGAQFAASPGLTGALLDASRRARVPLIPAVATVSEVVVAAAAGYDVLRLAPPSLLGGLSFLRSIAGRWPQLSFFPCGGIDAASFRVYQAEANVLCVGGSWMLPIELLERREWSQVRCLASEAAR